jgi:hypothetical protein
MILLTVLAGYCLLACTNNAYALSRLMGEVDLQYVDFSSRAPRSDSYQASSFSQRYALSYLTENRNYMRAPKPFEYTVFMGYEWQALDTTIKKNGITETDPSISNGRLFYLGEMDYDPPTMPLALHAYARDALRSRVEAPTNALGSSILSPAVPTVLADSGMNLNTGVTLTLGEKYGLRRNYGELFKHIPLIKFDYSEEVRRNDQYNARVDNRLRRLAFVSLNKKDNWFHYRTTSFTDHLNPAADWQRSEYQLGTINEHYVRKWVDLTNWIMISADAQFTKMQTQDVASDWDEYGLNLFSIASRKAWQLRTFATFTRRSEYGGINTERKIPLYLSGIWGAETDWSTSVTFRDRQYVGLNGAATQQEEDRIVTLRGTTWKRSPFTLSPMVSVQHLRTLAGSTLYTNGSIDLISTRRFSAVQDVAIRYDINSRLSTEPGIGNDYVKQALDGRWSTYVNNRLRISLQQQIAISTSLNNVAANQDLQNNYDFQQYTTTANVAWTPNANLSSSLSFSNDVTRYDGAGTSSRQNIRLALNHQTPQLKSGLYATANFEKIADGARRRAIDLTGNIDYTPHRHFAALLQSRYHEQHEENSTQQFVELVQKARYSIFPSFYTGRPIVELEEEFQYSQDFNGVDTGWVRLLARYYPYSRVAIFGSTTQNVAGGAQQIYSLGVSLNAKYFQTGLDYTYGRRSSDNRIDKRFAATVRRSF